MYPNKPHQFPSRSTLSIIVQVFNINLQILGMNAWHDGYVSLFGWATFYRETILEQFTPHTHREFLIHSLTSTGKKYRREFFWRTCFAATHTSNVGGAKKSGFRSDPETSSIAHKQQQQQPQQQL